MQLTNVVATDVKKVSEGVGEHGPWELWSLTVNGKQYSKFKGPNENLWSGMEIAYLEAEEKVREKNGKQYRNWSVTKMVLPESMEEPRQEPTQSPPQSTFKGKPDLPYSMKMSYVKDIACELIQKGVQLNEFPATLAVIWRAIENVTDGSEIPF